LLELPENDPDPFCASPAHMTLLRLHYPARVVAYLFVAGMLAATAHASGMTALLAALLVYCLAYPHVAQAWAMRHGEPPAAARKLMLVDSLNIGFGCAALGFGLLPSTYLLLVGTTNAVNFSGLKFGLLQLPVAALAMGIGVLVTGGYWQPMADDLTNGVAVVGLVAYGWMIGQNAYLVNLSLRRTRGELQAKSRQLEDMSLTDPLTGARNRRFLTRQLDALAGARRGEPFAFLLVDVDHFKRINDVHGHEAGDDVLRQMADRLRGLFPSPHEVVRWGGEEFLVLLRGAEAGDLLASLARTGASVRGEPFRLGKGGHVAVCVSAGAAPFPFGGLSWEHCIDLADRALYLAKHGGRDTGFAVLPGVASLTAEQSAQPIAALAANGCVQVARSG
jgi:diguanylate cyclase (GGDEF)-like protein